MEFICSFEDKKIEVPYFLMKATIMKIASNRKSPQTLSGLVFKQENSHGINYCIGVMYSSSFCNAQESNPCLMLISVLRGTVITKVSWTSVIHRQRNEENFLVIQHWFHRKRHLKISKRIVNSILTTLTLHNEHEYKSNKWRNGYEQFIHKLQKQIGIKFTCKK